MSYFSRAYWACRIGLVLALFSHNSCSSGSGSEPATLVSLSVSPGAPTVAVSLNRHLEATATYSDHSSSNRTAQAIWLSTAPGIATVAAGLVTGIAPGSALIVAELNGVADTADLTVTATAPALSSITVSPDPVTMAVGGTRSLVAIATYSDGSFGTATAQATWASTDATVASVAAGLVSGVSPGTAAIAATLGASSDTSHVTVTTTGPSGYVYPLKLGPTSRYLVDQDGKPFLLVGDAAWSLITQLSDAQADTYLASRQQHGFSLVLANLIERKFSSNAPADYYNLSPFSGTAFSSAPNEAYFAHADYIVRSAAQKGIVVLLAPAYLGYDCGDEGWCAEIEAASNADMTSWGAYIGNRYKDFDNIVWVIGGDASPNATVRSRLTAMINGIQQFDTRHLFTAHNQSEGMAIDPWSGAAWLTVNNVYSYSTTLYDQGLTAYHVAPVKPYFLIESAYENDRRNLSPQELRAQSYWTVLAGGFGNIYGNCPMWHFGSPSASSYCASTDWQAELTSPGSLNMQYFAKLFTARRWHLLVPDESNTALTAGLGSGSDYATAAVASDGSSIIAYLPSERTVTVNGSALGASMKAWWYDPSTGTSTLDGTYSTASAHNFSPPGNGDWVLVVDNASLNFPAP